MRFGDVLDGGDGNDTIRGLGGADFISAGSGNDWVEAGDGSDYVRGGSDNDTLYAGDGLADEMLGEEGDDLLIGSNIGNDKLFGGTGDDRLYGQAGNDVIEAGDGHDLVDGGAGTDTIFGQAGNDQLYAGTGAGDFIRGGEGDDLIHGSNDGGDQLLGESGRDRINGYAGNDVISGGTGDDILEGGEGDDLISGDEGSDLIVGGANHDVLYAFNSTNLNPDNSVDYMYGDFGTNGNEANSGSDQLYGSMGRDLLYGEAGDDLIDDNVSIAGIPQPAVSLDLIDYGTGDGANPTTFVAPPTTPNPLLQAAPAAMLPDRAEYPTGASDLGRWGELSNSASGAGLNRSGITSAPSIASTSTGTVVAWSEGYLGRSRIYVAQHDGTSWQELPALSGAGVYTAGSRATNPSLIVTSSGLATVAWTEHTDTGSQIMLAQYSPTANGGAGGWLALGSSLSVGGLSGVGSADQAQLIETSFGLMVVWQHQVGGITQAYARVFNGSAWVSIGAGSDSAGGITNGNATSDIRDVSVAARNGRVAIAWSQLDSVSNQRQVYLREFDGTAWQQINNSATGLGVSAAVQNGLTGVASNNLEPSLAYAGNDLLVTWQTHTDSQPLVVVARYSNSTSNPQLVFTTQVSGNSQPTLVSSASQTQLVWLHDTTRIFAARWNGTTLVEDIPGEASAGGIGGIGRQIDTLTASMDASGRASIGWLDLSQGTPNLMVRRNALPTVGSVFVATANGASIQSILDSQNLVAGDVIVVDGVINGNVSITAADAGVMLIGKPGSQIVGDVNIAGNNVGLSKLLIQGNVTATNVSQFYLRESSIVGRVTVHGGGGNQLSHNQIQGSTAGIVLSGDTNSPTVRYNQVTVALTVSRLAIRQIAYPVVPLVHQ